MRRSAISSSSAERRRWLLYARPLSQRRPHARRVSHLPAARRARRHRARAARRPARRPARDAPDRGADRRPRARSSARATRARRIPHPEAEDEVAELARTLEGMLAALDAARTETEATLDRQREFVADASHELRTPLTSVLANLELLAEELDGEQAETAEVGAALDPADAPAGRRPAAAGPRRRPARHSRDRPTDLGEVLIEAAAELGADGRATTSSRSTPQPARRRRRPRRAAPAGPQPAGERAPPHAARHADPRAAPGRGRRRGADRRGRRARASRRSCSSGCSSDSCAAAGDGGRGHRAGAGDRRCGGAVTRRHRRSLGAIAAATRHGRHALRDPFPHAARRTAPGDDVATARPAQTSTTTGRTIGRRRSRS